MTSLPFLMKTILFSIQITFVLIVLFLFFEAQLEHRI